jgi:8-amino-7-oxononanoate synthase
MLIQDPAIILGTPTLRSYLLNYARPLIYTTFLAYPSLVAIRTAYTFLLSPRITISQTHLHTLIRTLYNLLTTLVNTPPSSPSSKSKPLLILPAQCPQSPIFSIQLHEPKALAAFLQKRGMMVRAVVPPTVPEGTQRVRVCLHAGNTVEEVRRLVGAMEEWSASRASDGTEESAKGNGMVYARL